MPRYRRSRAELAAVRAGVGITDRRFAVTIKQIQTQTQRNLTTDNPSDKLPTPAWHAHYRSVFYQ